MKITEIEVDNFGIWHNLSLSDLDDRVTVFYGPNEAGKTTLLNFVRTILYGFSKDRRRYLPTVSGGQAGGSLHVSTVMGRFQLQRTVPSQPREVAEKSTLQPGGGRSREILVATPNDEADSPKSPASGYRNPRPHFAEVLPEKFRIISPAGGHQGNELLTLMLSGIDETIFNNVFAVGLRQMQELATLDDTEAAAELYGLATGVDRVCLAEVTRALEVEREAILCGENGTDGRLDDLWKRRERLERELQALRRDGAPWTKLRKQQRQLTRKIKQQDAAKARFDGDTHWRNLSAQLRREWARCHELNEELSELGPLVDVPRHVSERIDQLTEQIVQRRRQWEEIREERRHLKDRSRELRGRDTLCRNAAEIKALDRQRAGILALDEDAARWKSQLEDLEFEIQAELEALGLPTGTFPGRLPHVSEQMIEALRVPAREVKELRRHVEAAKKAAAECHDEAKPLEQQLEAASLRWNGENTVSALQRNRQLVMQLERRLELKQQCQDIATRLDQVQDENQYWRQRGVVPWRGILVICAIFATGAMLLLTGLLGYGFGLEDANRWTMMLIGGSLAVVSLGFKSAFEQRAVHKAKSCEHEIEILYERQQWARAESEELEDELATGEGDPERRLKDARRELAELEQLVPIRKRLDDLKRDAQATDHQVMIVARHLKEARRAWRASLRAAGLPETLTPSQIGKMSGQHLAQLQERASEVRLRTEERRQELATICQRIEQLRKLAELDDFPEGLGPQLDRLLAELEVHARASRECDGLRQRWEELGQRQQRIAKTAARLKGERREIFAEHGFSDLRDYRQTQSCESQAHDLRQERDQMLLHLSNVLSSVLESDVSVDTLRKQLDDQPSAVNDRLDELDLERETLETDLGELYERRGKLQQQIDALIHDRRQDKKELSLQLHEERIRAATTQWLRSAIASAVLEQVRHSYETKQQPVALAEASLFLEHLTEGRYTRIWTPLGQSTLCVDDHRSRTFSVEGLSRGTREQVFLALRLALVGSYRRRGVNLPVVLDDVLVNFDDQRARSAARVLMDVAKAGQQLLVFTCHQRIRAIFAELGGDVRNLPQRTDILDDVASPGARQVDRPARNGPEIGRQRFTPAWRDVHLKPLPDLVPAYADQHEGTGSDEF